MRFSIIVPVYNVEKYLSKCIQSLIDQDYNDYEILLIDDGSTDKSGIICEQYAKKYENIYVFHKKNGGLSDARNYGLQKALGDYILFVDSDDWIKKDILKEFSDIIENNKAVDVIETRFIEVYKNEEIVKDKKLHSYAKSKFDRKKAIKWILKKSDNTWPAPKRIYSKKFINSNNLHFLKGKLHEDVDWTSNVLKTANKFEYCNTPWYYHRMERENSITNKISAQNIIDLMEIAKLHYKRQASLLEEKIIKRIGISVYGKIKESSKCSYKEKELIIKYINNNISILKITPKLKYKLFYCFINIFGVKKGLDILYKF